MKTEKQIKERMKYFEDKYQEILSKEKHPISLMGARDLQVCDTAWRALRWVMDEEMKNPLWLSMAYKSKLRGFS